LSRADTGPPAPAPQLAEYQSSLMVLHQDNKVRKQMMAQPQAPPPLQSTADYAYAPSFAMTSMASMAPQQSNVAQAAPGMSLPSKMTRKGKKKTKSRVSEFLGLNKADNSQAQITSARRLSGSQAAALSVDLDNDEEEGEEDELADEMAVDAGSLSDTEKMHKIIDLQEFDGSWQISNKLLELIGVTENQFTTLNLDLGSSSVVGNKAHRATALAVAWLKTKLPKEEDVWDMVVEKAVGWLASEFGGEDSAEEAVKLAGKVF